MTLPNPALPGKPLDHDLDEIRRTVALLVVPGGVHELRVLGLAGYKKVASGYFNDLDLLAQAAVEWSGRGHGVYITLSPVEPALLARAANRVVTGPETTTSNNDVPRRRHILIDLDPRRPSGISSTEAEHQAALDCGKRIASWLVDRGFARPIYASSGNGCHLVFGVDLPNDDDCKVLVERCLAALDLLFSDDSVAVDGQVGKGAQLTKVYGTLVRKGDNTPDRPHRIARIIDAPNQLAVVPRDLLEELADQVPLPEQKRRGTQPRGDTSALDVSAWLAQHGIEARESAWRDGRRWILTQCPFSSDHAEGAYVVQLGNGAIGAGCQHTSCHGRRWPELRERFEPGYRERRETCDTEVGGTVPSDQDLGGNVWGLNVGDRVHPADRDNVGTITEITDREANVFFRSPGGHTASRFFPWSQLRPVGSVGIVGVAGPNDPWDEPTPLETAAPPFPLAALPTALRDWVEAEAEATQTPPDLAALVAISTIAAACSKKVEVLVRPGYVEPVNLYALAVLAVSDRKSAVFRAATAPLREHEHELAAKLAPAVRKYQAQRRILEGRRKKLEEKAARAHDDAEQRKIEQEVFAADVELAALPAVVIPRIIADDVSAERIASLLCEQRGRLAVLAPEGTILSVAAGRYSDGPALDNLLKAWCGDEIRVDRQTRPADYVRTPALTLFLAIQPHVLRAMAEVPAMRDQGLMARPVYAVPRSRVGSRRVDPSPVPGDLVERYRQLVMGLARIPDEFDDRGELRPRQLRLSPGADAVRLAFARWLEPQLGIGCELDGIADWAGKLVGNLVRIAAGLHMAEHCSGQWDAPISEETFLAVASIGHYLIPHARRALDLAGLDKNLDHARAITAWIRRGCRTEFTQRDALHDLSRFASAKNLDRPLEILAERGWIRLMPSGKPGKQGGRPRGTRCMPHPNLVSPQHGEPSPSKEADNTDKTSPSKTAERGSVGFVGADPGWIEPSQPIKPADDDGWEDA